LRGESLSEEEDPEFSGELLTPAMGKPPAGHGGDDRMVTVHLMMNTNRWIRDEGLRLEDTPSRGKLLKEPLSFLIINPRSLAYCLKYVFVF
jgi:hypothetical protein